MKENEVIVGKCYRHFKGNIYKILCIAKSSEDLSMQVVYQDTLDKEKIWIRNLDEFTSKVDHKKYPNCKAIYRFTYLGDL